MSRSGHLFVRPWKVAAAVVGTVTMIASGAGAASAAGLAVRSGPGVASTGSTAGKTATAACPWLDQSLPRATRVKMVLAKMTLADEITMVEGQGTAKPYVFYMAGIPSLCVPPMGLEDGPNGVGDGMKGVTQLPAGVSLAATWSPSLARSYGKVIGAEEAGKGASVNLGPTVNIDRSPRWGRSFESYTEDPFLDSAIATSTIRGVQSQGVMSQVKHFDAYNQETNRNTPLDNVIVSHRALHEIYMPAFNAAVRKAHVASVMCSYATVDGAYSCQNHYLLTTTLDKRWAFPGFVTSDYGAIHSTSAALAGSDMEQPFNTYFGQALLKEVQDGTVPRYVLNHMVSRILTEMFRFNLFNRPPTGSTSAVVTTPAHQAVSTKVAEAGTVLLKNSSSTLPLSAKHGGTIAVIGASASAAPTDTGGGSAYVTSTFNVTPLQGLQAAAGSGTKIVYQQGLPVDNTLPAIPSSSLSPAYTATGYGGSYTGTLVAPETGTYVLAVKNPCGCYSPTYLSLDGKELLADPGTPPVSTYSAAVTLQAGQSYTLSISGDSSVLAWATPSMLAPGIAAAVSAAKSAKTAVVVVSDNTESEAADRATLNLPSAQNELISAVAAANPHTVVVIDAGAPVVMPWLSHVSAVVDAWYPGESNGTALAAVLYGKVDPGGHLPVTFPVNLAQTPTASPARFPGVGGKVHYSPGGLLVGYRYYDAKGVAPLFPFGYGLSYTTFKFSHLRVTPSAVVNRSSGPGPTSCHCNGQSSKLVTVSARVTNTGSRGGSDVAQLYLGDPSVAGQPPRQLEGFQKVYLAPGQSQTVRFTLNGHELSYWDSAANGWVVPDGHFGVFVGDSSASSGLPLRGSFAVTRTVGARYATISAPSSVAPDASFAVVAHFINGGDYVLHHAKTYLQAPAGWKVLPEGTAASYVPAHGSVTRRFEVTAPVAAQGTKPRLIAKLVYNQAGLGPTRKVLSASARVGVDYAVVVSATPVTVVPGASATATVSVANRLPRTVEVSLRASPPAGISVSPSQTDLSVPPSGATTKVSVSVASSTGGGSYSVPLSASFTSGTRSFSVPVSDLAVTVPFPSVPAAYDNVGISSDTATSSGNFDGGGDSYSAQALVAVGLAPGAAVKVAGVSVAWPDAAAGSPDNVIAEGQTIDVSGSGTTLALLGASNNGTGTGTLTVHYSDGTSQSQTISFADWYANSPVTGDQLVATTSHWNHASGIGKHPVSVYSTTVGLQPGKTVTSLTLPDVSSGVSTNSENAMHVFAVGIGN